MEIMRTLAALFVCSLTAFAQYKSEPAGAPPAEVAPAIAQVMQKTGTKITNNGAAYCEIWFRTDKPSGAKSTEENITLPLPQGALLGVIRFTGNESDRRATARFPAADARHRRQRPQLHSQFRGARCHEPQSFRDAASGRAELLE